MHVPSLPPSVNNAYFTKNNARRLSDKGKKYKLETTAHIARSYPQELRFFTQNKMIGLFVVFTFADHSELFVKGYPEKTNNRYKKNDVGNRLKLFEDALSDATGIDDSHNWVVCLSKQPGRADGTYIWAWDLDDGNHDAFTLNIAGLLAFVRDEQNRAVPAVP